MANEKRYGGAIVVPDDVEMHSPVDIVDDMVEALRFYDSRTSAAKDNDLIRRGDLKNLLLKRSFFPAIVAAALKEIPKVDAVEVDTVAEMLAYVHGDECACNFGCHDEWLSMVCDYAETECPRPKEPNGCWKQFVKHWGERKDNGC